MSFIPLIAIGRAVPAQSITGVTIRTRMENRHTPVFPAISMDPIEVNHVGVIIGEIVLLLGTGKGAEEIVMDSIEVPVSEVRRPLIGSEFFSSLPGDDQKELIERNKFFIKFLRKKEAWDTLQASATQSAESTGADIATLRHAELEIITEKDIEKNEGRKVKIAKVLANATSVGEVGWAAVVDSFGASKLKAITDRFTAITNDINGKLR